MHLELMEKSQKSMETVEILSTIHVVIKRIMMNRLHASNVDWNQVDDTQSCLVFHLLVV